MEGLNEILNKLSVQDIEKLKMLFSIGADTTTKEVVTLRVFCDEYRKHIKSNRANNYYKSVGAALKHLVNYFGLQRALHSITYKETEMFITDLQQNVTKGYRVYFRTLKAAFNKAVDWDYIQENHFLKVKLPKKNKLNPQFINESQLQKILSQINAEVVKDFVVFALNTGMRLNEIINLKWNNIDFEKRMIIVGDEEFTTKGKNQRYVPFSEEVEKILHKRQTENVQMEKGNKDSSIVSLFQNDKNKHLFSKLNGEAYTGDYFSRRFKRACRDAGMDESIHFHTLRHSFASRLAQKGVNLYVIKELLGHSSISTTEIYSHLNVDSLREAVGKLDTRCEIEEMRKAENEIPHQVRNDRSEGLKLIVNKK